MKNTYDDLVQVWNFLLPLSLKVLRHKEERCTIFLWWLFHLPPITCAPYTRPLAWLQRALKVNHLPPSQEPNPTQLNWLTFFQNPPNPLCALPVHDVIHMPKSQPSVWDFHVDICEQHIPPQRACQHPRPSLHPTNPCAELKGSQPN